MEERRGREGGEKEGEGGERGEGRGERGEERGEREMRAAREPSDSELIVTFHAGEGEHE